MDPTTTDRLRLRKSELFASLGYSPHPGQIAIHRSRAPRRVVACGARFGKSMAGAFEAIAALLEPRETSLGWLVAPNFGLTSRIFRRVVGVLHERLPHRILSFDPRSHAIVVANFSGGRSELRAKSADSAVSLLGEALDWLIVDEAAQVRDDVWDEFLSQRLIDRRGTSLLLSTPAGNNWFFQEFRRARKDPAYASWSMPSWENPHVPRDLIEAERARLPKAVFDEMYGAVFANVAVEQCETCGGPSMTMVPVIILYDSEPESRCPACGDFVDKSGRTIVPQRDGMRCEPRIIRAITDLLPPPGMPGDEEPEGRALPS